MIVLSAYYPGILAAYSILLVGAFSPGPSVAMLIGIATGQGRLPALAATLGIALGSLSINVFTLLGVGLLLSQVAWAMSILRVLGALYLLYLAYAAFKRVAVATELQPANSSSRAWSTHFISGYLLQITNPKAIAFWLAISSIGAVRGADTGIVVVFVAGAFLISFFCHAAWAVALSVNTIRAMYISWRQWVEAALGCFFTFAAYKLMFSEQ